MSKRYSLPLHIKKYVKQELYDYEKNKLKVQELQHSSDTIASNTLLIVTKRILNIKKAIEKLNEEDRKIAKLIFFEKQSQQHIEAFYYISKDVYYNIMNKAIYLVAKEMELIED